MSIFKIKLRIEAMKINSFTKVKKNILAGSLLFGVLLHPLSSSAITVEEIPNPRTTNGGWVSDTADILSDSTEAQLNQMISELEAKKGAEIAVVTVDKTSDSPSPKAFTTELFNYWSIGKKDVNNGVLYLISVGDRRVEIETGYGLTKILPDKKVKNIIDTQITPRYKQGNFDSGTLEGTKSIVNVLEKPISYDQIFKILIMLPLFGFTAFLIILITKKNLQCPQCKKLGVRKLKRIIKQPTKKSQGKASVKYQCRCCGYITRNEEIVMIPRLESYSYSSSSSSTYGGYSGGGCSGGGGFGGGCSGGGGAGGSF